MLSPTTTSSRLSVGFITTLVNDDDWSTDGKDRWRVMYRTLLTIRSQHVINVPIWLSSSHLQAKRHLKSWCSVVHWFFMTSSIISDPGIKGSFQCNT
ncbi:hypothetical protein GUJ93_ZPchr0002g23361 [Zizania palustris]|uniref:Uncharacterized protein n=1 Tax=Zizania palustris TaxID=103762 RepID=A0A8J5SPP6_ZIZPA|nr:hypothetical protein GUJ93_ZPchr0002g23361 [Zizania palustris]